MQKKSRKEQIKKLKYKFDNKRLPLPKMPTPDPDLGDRFDPEAQKKYANLDIPQTPEEEKDLPHWMPPKPGRRPRTRNQDIAFQRVIAKDDPSLEVIVYANPSDLRGHVKYTVGEIADAIRIAGGVRAEVARILRVSYPTVNNYFQRFPELEDVQREAEEETLDKSEVKLQEHIENGSLQGLMFFLKTKGRTRGYGQRVDKTELKLDLNRLTDRQLEQLASGVPADQVLLGGGS